MPFKKESGDPWDRKPEKRSPAPVEPKETPMDALKQWKEARTAAEAEKAAPDLPPEKCPWCGKDMEQGYLVGGRGIVLWYPGRLTTKAAWFGRRDVQGLDVLDERGEIAHKTVWLCRECKKMTFDAPDPMEPPEPYRFFNLRGKPAGETEEET